MNGKRIRTEGWRGIKALRHGCAGWDRLGVKALCKQIH